MSEARSRLMRSLGNGRLLAFDVEKQRATLEFDAHVDMCHSGNVVQGGFVTGWIDSAMAHAAMLATEGAMAPSSLEIKVSFLRPANPGVVRAEGWIVRLGRSIAFLEGRLLNAAGEVVATCTSTAKMTPTQRPGEPTRPGSDPQLARQ